jgi:outer membrane scaffolding protein for murein synthesis (MipA/OmpV family)
MIVTSPDTPVKQYMSFKIVIHCIMLFAACRLSIAGADPLDGVEASTSLSAGSNAAPVSPPSSMLLAGSSKGSSSSAQSMKRVVDKMLGMVGEDSASWSLGIGVAAGAYPHYPGATQSEAVIAPFPFPEYHSDRVDLDRNGLAAKLFQADRLELDFSMNGAFPVSADDNTLRAGMADLELMLEFGPELQITLATWDNATLRFDVPVRGAFEVTTSQLPDYIGWNTDPRLHFEHTINDWQWEIDFGVLWANQKYQSVFYSVTDADVTATRPLFEAEAGMLAWRLSATVERRIGDWILLGYLRQMDLSGSENRDSTLLAQNSYLAGGVAAIWMFASN